MNYQDCCNTFSSSRMERYKNAVGEEKAVKLYLLNLSLSRELFHLVSIFEIVLRNKIDTCLKTELGDDEWLYNSIQPKTNPALKYQGCFLQYNTKDSAKLIWDVLFTMQSSNIEHNKIVAALGFGFWRYLFAGGKNAQYEATGKVLMKVFPNKPKTTQTMQYNQKWIFDELSKINRFRNRLAHHEPVCFHGNNKSTVYACEIHALLINLLSYMGVDTTALSKHFGDNVVDICNQIDAL